MNIFLWLLRIIVGGLFIFSGLIKAIDPSGLRYKMDEFFEVWGMHGFSKFSLVLAILMIGFEIIAGVALLLGYAQRVFSALLLALIIFFTFLTAYVLFSGKIKECGCFGDCIKITPWQTFTKDIVLLVMAVALFAFRKRLRPVLKTHFGTAAMILTVFFSFGIQVWALEHGPIVDCLPYKKSANLWQKMQPPPGCIPDSFSTVLVYEKGGVQKEFDATNFPWQDTTWKFVDNRTKQVRVGNCNPEVKDFSLKDYDNNDHTQEILTAPGYAFLWFVRDPAKARTDRMERLVSLARQAQRAGVPFYILSSASRATSEAFQQQHNLVGIDMLQVDGVASKTAMRTNPGLMLLKDGTVQEKWSFRDYPGRLALNNGVLELK